MSCISIRWTISELFSWFSFQSIFLSSKWIPNVKTAKNGQPEIVKEEVALTQRELELKRGITIVRRLIKSFNVLPAQTKTSGAYEEQMKGEEVKTFLRKELIILVNEIKTSFSVFVNAPETHGAELRKQFRH